MRLKLADIHFFILEFVLCTNSSLFKFKRVNEHREFRNYLKYLQKPTYLPAFLTLPAAFIAAVLKYIRYISKLLILCLYEFHKSFSKNLIHYTMFSNYFQVFFVNNCYLSVFTFFFFVQNIIFLPIWCDAYL